MNIKQYNELKEKIISANKDIVELKFGCKIKGRKLKGTVIWSDNISTAVLWKNGKYETMTQYLPNKKEIIGRPITLCDCLIAIESKALVNEDGEPTFVMINDNGMIQTELYNWEEEPVFWIMGKFLQDQPEETKQLLYNLICKK